MKETLPLLTKMAELDQVVEVADDHHYERQRMLSPKTNQNDNEKIVVVVKQRSSSSSSSSSNREEEKKGGLGGVPVEAEDAGKEESSSEEEENGRERLKRHRIEVAGRVWIPEIWGQEDLLKDWIDCNAFDACLVPNGIMSARASLVEEGRRAKPLLVD